MAQEDSLRMATEVVDKFSGPLREMQKGLRALQAQIKGTHSQGKKEAKEHAEAYHKLRESIAKLTEHVKGGLEPALEGLGVGAIGAAAGIAAVGEAVRDFAGTSRELSYLSRETRLSIQTLREYDALANRIGSSPDAMRQGFARFADNMEQFRHNVGPLQQWFASQHHGAERLGLALKHTASQAEALADVEDALAKIQNPTQRSYLLSALGLDPKLARLSGQELHAALADIRKGIGELSPEDLARGNKAATAFDHIRESVTKLKEELAIGLEPAITEITGELSGWVEQQDWKKIGEDIGGAAKAINETAQAFGGWKTVIEAIVALKFAGWALRTTSAVAALIPVLRTLFTMAAPPWLAAITAMVGAAGQVASESKRALEADKRGERTTPNLDTGGLLTDEDILGKGFKGRIPDVPKADNGLFHKEAWTGGAGFSGGAATNTQAEVILERAVLKGSTEGTKAGLLAAFEDLRSGGGSGGGGGGSGGGGFRSASYGGAAAALGGTANGGGGGGGGGAARSGGRSGGAGDVGELPASSTAGTFPESLKRGSPELRGKLSGGNFYSPAEVYAGYRALGLSHDDAANLASVQTAESRSFGGKLYTGSFGNQPTERGGALNPRGAWGISQLNGIRQARLKQFAEKLGLDPGSLEANQRFSIFEARKMGVNLGSISDVVNRFESPALKYRAGEIAAASRVRSSLERFRGADFGGLREKATAPRSNRYDDSILDRARRGGFGGGGGRINGNVAMSIDLNGFPKGTSTRVATSELFGEVQLNRGRAMPMASQDS